MTKVLTIDERIEDIHQRISRLGRHDALRRQHLLLRLHELQSKRTQVEE